LIERTGREARILAVSRALPKYVNIDGKRVLTSIVRDRSTTPLAVETSGIEGNMTAVHTEHILAFAAEDYDYWTDRFGHARGTWPFCFWGENVTYCGIVEGELQVGTLLHIGQSAVLQVTSPRNPCFKLAWRIGQPDSTLTEILDSGRGGVYLRAVKPGVIFDGDTIRLTPAEESAPTIAHVARLLNRKRPSKVEDLRQVLSVESLGGQCAGMLRQRLSGLLDNERINNNRWDGWRPFQVSEVREVASGIKSFTLRPKDGGNIAPYLAGQHVRVRLERGDGRHFIRCWSLSDYCERPDHYRLSIKKSDRPAASAYIHEHISHGSMVEVAAPSGNFTLDRTSSHPTVLISAGIGITPLLAMLKAYIADPITIPPLQWIHVTKNRLTYPHREEVRTAIAQRKNMYTHLRFTAPLREDKLGTDYDAAGRVTLEELRAIIDRYRYMIFGREVELPGASSEFYLCGPARFEESIREMLEKFGTPPSNIRSENFSVTDYEAAKQAWVRFARSDIEVVWRPGFSILETAEEAGISAPHECRSGTCHTCLARVLEGRVSYPRRPDVLPPDDMALLCCSRPATPKVVLDL
jgi:uncharacterized protein